MGTGRKRLGAVGEQLAAHWYEQHGFTVVERNWRCRTANWTSCAVAAA